MEHGQCAREDASEIVISEIWSSSSPVERDLRRVYTTEEKWHRSDKMLNGSIYFCKKKVSFYPFCYRTIGANCNCPERALNPRPPGHHGCDDHYTTRTTIMAKWLIDHLMCGIYVGLPKDQFFSM